MMTAKTHTNHDQRGFSLIELMLAAALSSIVLAGVFGTMIVQQQVYTTQLELSEAAQNARAALDIVRASLRSAGWGMVSSHLATGIPAVGTCYAANLADQSTCNDLVALNDNSMTTLSDRVRAVGIQPGSTFTRNTDALASNTVTVNDATRTQLVVGDLAIVSGTCTAPAASAHSAVVKITAVSSSGGKVNYTYNGAVAGYPTIGCTAMAAGHAFGLARIVEFYIDRAKANTDPQAAASRFIPRLMMMINRNGRDAVTNTLPLEQTVAYDIDNLQVRYGLDCGAVASGAACTAATDANPDDVVDWISASQQFCNDLRLTNCATGKTVIENQVRTMAVQVAIVPRTRGLRRDTMFKAVTGNPLTVFGYTTPADSYRRWIFRSTIALRNNQLPIPKS